MISEGSQPEYLGDATRAPSRYRPPQQRPARVPVTKPNTQPQRSQPGDILLRVKVRLMFDHQGFCQIGFLPERSPDLDDEVLVKLQGDSLRLIAQEDWYQDIQFDNPCENPWQGGPETIRVRCPAVLALSNTSPHRSITLLDRTLPSTA